ncbi:helix-turn-helix domain-containing protein [Companilactobacillus huachuanensis]|uniref:Helix-turn-helix domain-containing protein n=1 Tax=Companilactobacillus huachuanensis TaxID=2559914 RepID=A0ABW1RPA2_9LACO|nr:helix-turn-helix domain-containing protein [Companilactobacillus huachuanensis]
MVGSVAKFLELYPSAKLTTEPVSNATSFNCLIAGQWINVDKSSLTEPERFLLSLMSQGDASKAVQNNWWQFLTGKSDDHPTMNKNVRIIQFEIQKNETKKDSFEWLKVFRETFDDVVDSFLISNNSGILIEKESASCMDKENVQQMVQLLDSDFYTNSNVYIGQFWSVDEKLPNIFKVERRLFNKSVEMRERVNNLSTVVLDFLVEQNLKNTDLFESLREKIEIDHRSTQMIDALYRCDSNLAKTSKMLFLHRNTLLYRIEKFYEQTGFDLKDRDDLVLCFLLLK